MAERYFIVLQSEDALESIESEIDALTNQLDQIQNLFDRQLAQITDLYQGRASLASAEAERFRGYLQKMRSVVKGCDQFQD